MTDHKTDERPALLAELLLFHAVLGRGYISPFPVTKGMVFTSALPRASLAALAGAESKFRNWHEESLKADRELLEQLEREQGGAMDAVTGGKRRCRELRDKLNRLPHVTWKSDDANKSTMVEVLKTHFYGAVTYLDGVGARLAASVSHSSRLARDLGWYTLTEGTTDEALIRSTSSGGAQIHTLAGLNPIFNYYCACGEQHLEKFREKIKDCPGGQVGIGRCVIIPGRPGSPSGVDSDLLFSLLQKVYTLGDQDHGKRVKVVFSAESAAGWRKFIGWELPDLLGEEKPSNWQWALADKSPTSPSLAVLFAARAALVSAFLDAARANSFGDIKQVELADRHLGIAENMARMLYARASGGEGMAKRIRNLKVGTDNYITPQRLSVAKRALEDAIMVSDSGRISRNQVCRDIDGVTLGLLDELVRRGDFTELSGVEECQLGKVRKAYCLPKDSPGNDENDAYDEFDEAREEYVRLPDSIPDSVAIDVAAKLRERAEDVFLEHYAPVVALSRMTKRELRALPRVLAMFSESFLLRGRGTEFPEPAAVLQDEDMPVDREGANLWVRCRPNGQDFCAWATAGFLQLQDVWGDDTKPLLVPAQ